LTRCESPTSTHFSESSVQGCPVHYTAEHLADNSGSHHSTQAPSDISVFRLPRISFHCPKLRWSTPAIFDRYQSRRPTGTTHIARLLFAQRLSWSQGCLWPHWVQTYGVTMTNAVSGNRKSHKHIKQNGENQQVSTFGALPMEFF
jgi:hypothetical protein